MLCQILLAHIGILVVCVLSKCKYLPFLPPYYVPFTKNITFFIIKYHYENGSFHSHLIIKLYEYFDVCVLVSGVL